MTGCLLLTLGAIDISTTLGIIGATIHLIIGATIIIGILGITDRGGAFIHRHIITARAILVENHRTLIEDQVTDMEAAEVRE